MISRYEITSSGIIDSADATAPVSVYLAPSELERIEIGTVLHLDDYNLDSSLDPDEVSRLEMIDDRVFLIWKTPESARALESVELGVRSVGAVLYGEKIAFIMNSGFVSFREREYQRNDGPPARREHHAGSSWR